ncbi:serine threonine protein kinase [Leptolyngbya sp. Heron Island J]|uniref:protein kinase domain-containing protein n=1 Tax=Leptolyngbya sp. Heron Island J TaxID=1385935 RepID=UPI0003B965B7|nr:D-alanyl-D-alanine carboxypeptidase family protein [Leptolyngbya sp. Heron Island J]ESA37219.1 serine threonine protein kinase [Leptolyngbya sp. Heron Island J]
MKLANRFEVLEILDRGGYGITYRAIDHHQPHRPQCVLKELAYTNPKILEMLRQEASTLEKLGIHSRIPKLLAYFEQGNKFYVVQEMVQGHTLRQEIRAGKRLDESYVTKLLKDVLSVLTFVHQHQTIHLDIQPGNLIRQASNGDIFLTDFGVLKTLSNSQINKYGQLITTAKVGKAGYTAPEQTRGKPCYASDLYAVGMVAIAALTESPPHKLTIHPLTRQVQWSKKKISPALTTFIKRLIEPNPNKRYTTAREALKALERTITGMRVGQDSQLPTHVAAKGNLPIDTEPATKAVTLIPPKLILKVIGLITALLVVLGFGVKGYQWAAYTISRQWDAVQATPKGFDQAQPDDLIALLDDGSIQARPETVDAFWNMVAAAQNEGVELLPLAGYISLSDQRKQLQKRDEDIDIRQWLQQSDYHSGYAVAFGDKNADESTDWDISFEQTDGYRWLRRYAKNYEFELSYPQGNPAGEKEPWHWRYTGD